MIEFDLKFSDFDTCKIFLISEINKVADSKGNNNF